MTLEMAPHASIIPGFDSVICNMRNAEGNEIRLLDCRPLEMPLFSECLISPSFPKQHFNCLNKLATGHLLNPKSLCTPFNEGCGLSQRGLKAFTSFFKLFADLKSEDQNQPSLSHLVRDLQMQWWENVSEMEKIKQIKRKVRAS